MNEEYVRHEFAKCADMMQIIRTSARLKNEGYNVVLLNRLRKEAQDNLAMSDSGGFKKVTYEYVSINDDKLFNNVADIDLIPKIANFITVE